MNLHFIYFTHLTLMFCSRSRVCLLSSNIRRSHQFISKFSTRPARAMAVSLHSFLQQSRQKALSNFDEGQVTAVIGNPSCDLDSFVSAVLFAYISSLPGSKETPDDGPTHIPLLNLPDHAASELWRLRPEFGAALRLATKTAAQDPPSGDDRKTAKDLLSNLTTLRDISDSQARNSLSCLVGRHYPSQSKLRIILVDHNSPAISNVSSRDLNEWLDLTGCIDHHVDESTVPAKASLRIIQTGVGSCTSLVVQYLRDAKLWPAKDFPEDQQKYVPELAKLALAPILIDTFNLKATGDKCADLDRDVVAFLEKQISSSSPATAHTAADVFNRESFFNQINESKQSALDLLTLPEILSHDYKSWSEIPSSSSKGLKVKIGTSSLVRSLRWLIVEKSDSSEHIFIEHLLNYMSSQRLDVLALLTRASEPPTTPSDTDCNTAATSRESTSTVRKELLILHLKNADAKLVPRNIMSSCLQHFTDCMSSTLDLRPHRGDEPTLIKELDWHIRDKGQGDYRLWWQGDTEKSRKQIAPAIRKAVRRSEGWEWF